MANFFQKPCSNSKKLLVTISHQANLQNGNALAAAKEELNQAIAVQEKVLARIYELQNLINDLEIKIKQKNIPKFLSHPLKSQQANIEHELNMLKTKFTDSHLPTLIANRSKEIEELSLVHNQQIQLGIR